MHSIFGASMFPKRVSENEQHESNSQGNENDPVDANYDDYLYEDMDLVIAEDEPQQQSVAWGHNTLQTSKKNQEDDFKMPANTNQFRSTATLSSKKHTGLLETTTGSSYSAPDQWKDIPTIPNWYTGLENKKSQSSSSQASQKTLHGETANSPSADASVSQQGFAKQTRSNIYGSGVTHLETFGVDKSSAQEAPATQEFSAFGMFANIQVPKDAKSKKKRGSRGTKKRKKDEPEKGQESSSNYETKTNDDPYMDMYGLNEMTTQSAEPKSLHSSITKRSFEEQNRSWGQYKIPKQEDLGKTSGRKGTQEMDLSECIDLTKDDDATFNQAIAGSGNYREGWRRPDLRSPRRRSRSPRHRARSPRRRSRSPRKRSRGPRYRHDGSKDTTKEQIPPLMHIDTRRSRTLNENEGLSTINKAGVSGASQIVKPLVSFETKTPRSSVVDVSSSMISTGAPKGEGTSAVNAPKYMCKVCQIPVTGLANIPFHTMGKKHKKNLASLKMLLGDDFEKLYGDLDEPEKNVNEEKVFTVTESKLKELVESMVSSKATPSQTRQSGSQQEKIQETPKPESQMEQLANIVAEKIIGMTQDSPTSGAPLKRETMTDGLLTQLGLSSGSLAESAVDQALNNIGQAEYKKQKKPVSNRAQSVSSIQPAWMKKQQPTKHAPPKLKSVIQPSAEYLMKQSENTRISALEQQTEKFVPRTEVPKSNSDTETLSDLDQKNLEAMNRMLESVGVTDEASLAQLVAAAIDDPLVGDTLPKEHHVKPVSIEPTQPSVAPNKAIDEPESTACIDYHHGRAMDQNIHLYGQMPASPPRIRSPDNHSAMQKVNPARSFTEQSGRANVETQRINQQTKKQKSRMSEKYPASKHKAAIQRGRSNEMPERRSNTRANYRPAAPVGSDSRFSKSSNRNRTTYDQFTDRSTSNKFYASLRQENVERQQKMPPKPSIPRHRETNERSMQVTRREQHAWNEPATNATFRKNQSKERNSSGRERNRENTEKRARNTDSVTDEDDMIIARQISESTGITDMSVLLQVVGVVKRLDPEVMANLADLHTFMDEVNSGEMSYEDVYKHLPTELVNLVDEGAVSPEMLEIFCGGKLNLQAPPEPSRHHLDHYDEDSRNDIYEHHNY